MSDLISRQDAIDALNDVVTITGFTNATVFQDYVRRVNNRLQELPSAQPEIIRCKDCKHYVLHVLFGRSQGWCERLCDEFDKSLARGTEADDFCSRAESREEKGE